MNEPATDSLVILGKRGRPPAQEQLSRVSTWVPVDAHDRLIELAKQQRGTVSSVVRKILVKQVRPGRA